MTDIFQEYDYHTRKIVMEKYNLSRTQCNLLVKAYDDLAVIGGLLFRSDRQKEDIRYIDETGQYHPLPRIMRAIVTKTKKDDFHKYFSPFMFKKFFGKFVASVLSPEYQIQTGADILGDGLIAYKKQKSIQFEVSSV